MSRVFISPAAYVQGPGLLDDPGHLEFLTGKTAYVLGGETALSVVGDALADALTEVGIEVGAMDDDVAACTHETIEHYRSRRAAVGADIVVGVGGGVAIDVATAVAMGEVEFVSVPTIASTDAPCTKLSVVYDDRGYNQEVLFRERNPDLVLVDTQVIAEAPARFLRHGLGDAFATKFEAEAAAAADGGSLAGGRWSYAARSIARECYRTIAGQGPRALAAVERDAVTPAVERVVEANVLLSGVGAESGGVAAAHPIQVGLVNTGVRAPHGILVGFSTVAQLVLENHEALEDTLGVARDLGLDVTLADIGANDVDLKRVGEIACERGINEPFETSPRVVADAIRAADELLQAR